MHHHGGPLLHRLGSDRRLGVHLQRDGGKLRRQLARLVSFRSRDAGTERDSERGWRTFGDRRGARTCLGSHHLAGTEQWHLPDHALSRDSVARDGAMPGGRPCIDVHDHGPDERHDVHRRGRAAHRCRLGRFRLSQCHAGCSPRRPGCTLGRRGQRRGHGVVGSTG